MGDGQYIALFVYDQFFKNGRKPAPVRSIVLRVFPVVLLKPVEI